MVAMFGLTRIVSDSLLFQNFDCLTSGVVELSSFANFQRAAAKNENLMVILFDHNISMNSLNMVLESVGPGAASGWN